MARSISADPDQTTQGRAQPRRFAHIDAMRGYAVLGVMAVHAGQSAPLLHGPLRDLAASGAYGVQLFFVASALTLMYSWRARAEGTAAFLVRRLFRVAPMFWLAIGFYLWLFGLRARYAAPNGISAADVVVTAAFLHGLRPYAINSVVPGGWSIAVETTFYLMFPALASGLRSLRRAAAAFLAALVLAWLLDPWAQAAARSLNPDEPEYLASDFAYFWIVNQLPVFLVGFVAFHVARDFRVSPRAARAGAMASACAILVLPFLPLVGPAHVYYAVVFGVFAVCGAEGGVLLNAPIRWLGKISYSAYLWQFAILKALSSAPRWTGPIARALRLDTPERASLAFALMLLALLALTAAFAAATFLLVERPMVALGGRIASEIERRRTGFLRGAT